MCLSLSSKQQSVSVGQEHVPGSMVHKVCVLLRLSFLERHVKVISILIRSTCMVYIRAQDVCVCAFASELYRTTRQVYGDFDQEPMPGVQLCTRVCVCVCVFVCVMYICAQGVIVCMLLIIKYI